MATVGVKGLKHSMSRSAACAA